VQSRLIPSSSHKSERHGQGRRSGLDTDPASGSESNGEGASTSKCCAELWGTRASPSRTERANSPPRATLRFQSIQLPHGSRTRHEIRLRGVNSQIWVVRGSPRSAADHAAKRTDRSISYEVATC
jgi:hypothetical protein